MKAPTFEFVCSDSMSTSPQNDDNDDTKQKAVEDRSEDEDNNSHAIEESQGFLN